jgi:hypothetical protein
MSAQAGRVLGLQNLSHERHSVGVLSGHITIEAPASPTGALFGRGTGPAGVIRGQPWAGADDRAGCLGDPGLAGLGPPAACS